MSTRIVAVPLHHDRVMAAHKPRNCIAVVVLSLIVIPVRIVANGLVVALAPAVKPVDDRVALARSSVISWQKNAIVARFAEDLALVRFIQH